MPTISSRIQAELSEAIIGGTYPPGTRLDERSLAEKLNVSRTPVREALRQLATRGLVQLEPMRGAVVASISLKDISDLLNVDCELEALCARIAAESMSAMEKQELEFVHQQGKECALKGNLEGYLEANAEFHRLILDGTHNGALSRLAADVRERLSPYRQYHPQDKERLRTASEAHDAIVNAILAGQAEQAYLSMRAHNLRLGGAALRALKSQEESKATNVSPLSAPAPAKRARQRRVTGVSTT